MADNLYDGLEVVDTAAGATTPVPKAQPSMYDGLEIVPQDQPRSASGLKESVWAGLQGSVFGHAWRQKVPDLVMNPETSKWWERLAAGVTQVASDLPIMIPAGAAGTAAGTAATGPIGGVLAGGAAMFSAPAFIRESLIQSFRSGEINTAADWFNAIRQIATHTAKEGAIGAATMGTGALAKTGAAALLGGGAASTAIGTGQATLLTQGAQRAAGAADVVAQIGAMTTAGKIANLQSMPENLRDVLPDLREIGDAAAVIFTLKGGHVAYDHFQVSKIADKIADTYVKTGRTPAEQVADIQSGAVKPEDFMGPPTPAQNAASLRPASEDMFGRAYNPTGTTSGVPLALDKLIAEAEQLGRGGVPEAPDVKALVRELKAAGPLQTDMVSGIDRLEGLISKAKTDAGLTDAEKGEAVVLKGKLTNLAEQLTTPVLERATVMGGERLQELATKAENVPLTDAERAERVFLTNAKPEALATHFKLIDEGIKPITRREFDASADRVRDDILQQLKDVDEARRATGQTPIGGDHAEAVATLVRARIRTRAERLGMLPEDLYNERRLQIRDEAQAEAAAAAPPEGAQMFTPPETDLFGNPVEVTNAPRFAVEGLATVETPLDGLILSKEVPQFKKDANDKGVVVPLGGKFDRTGVGPIQVWERLDGTREIISGRHRWDLAVRSGETTIPAQIHREADGFTARQAATLDAQLNIREEQGGVADYAQYFKDSGISKESADELGLLARAKGRAGFAIARDASPDLAAAHRAGLLSDDAALSISAAAPGSERMQALGIAMVNDGKSILMAVNTMKAVELMAADRMMEGKQGDIFGFDDSAMLEAQAMAKKASSMQRRIGEQISAVSGASRRPELAKKMGVDVADPEGIQKRIVELRQEQYLWDNWPLHPELVARLRGELGQGPIESKMDRAILAGLKAADREQAEQRKHAANEAAEDLRNSGRIDVEDMRENPKYWDAEAEDMTDAGRAEYQRREDALAAQEAESQYPTPTELSHLDKAHQFAQRDAMEAILDVLGIDYSIPRTWSTSRYIEVTLPNGETAKIRFADHANQVRDTSMQSDINVAPGEYTFTDALEWVREKFRSELGQPAIDPTDPNILHQEPFDLTPETPAELKARDDEAAAAARRKVAQEKLADKLGKKTIDQADLFNEQKTLFQSKEPFYSELARQIEGLKQPSASAAQWKGTIKNLKGVKADEIEASGINDWLDAQGGKVTKEQVSQFLAGNGVKVTEVTLGGEMQPSMDMLNKYAMLRYEKPWSELTPYEQPVVMDYVKKETENTQTPKYSQYQLPGGKNYRELLLTLPAGPSPEALDPLIRSLSNWPRDSSTARDPARQSELDELNAEWSRRDKTMGGKFQSSHFDQLNILAHIRFNERTDAEGKKVLFLEEIQSDWAQKGKKEGFENKAAAEDFRARMAAKHGDNWVPKLTDAEMNEYESYRHGPPSAPFVTNTEAWTSLALKRMIRYAAENGFDKIAWTRGEQQVERYTSALRKAVDVIEWKKTDKGVQLVGYKGTHPDPGYRNKVVDTTQQENELSDAIGKAMADRIIKDPAQEGTIEGDGIHIDSTGMAGFYDRILPNVANKVLKKLGGDKVSEVKLPGSVGLEKFDMQEDGNSGRWVLIDRETNRPAEGAPTFRRGADAEKWIANNTQSAQTGFTITPEVKAKALEGQPLFQQNQDSNRASYDIAEKMITTFQGADKSSVVHELGHDWLEEMKADAARPNAPESIKADWDLLRRELAIPENGEIPRSSHEQWARSVERMLGEGEAPTAELRSVFARFREWLLAIYNDLRNLNVTINPELKGILDRMLATDQEIADAQQLNVPRAYVGEAKATEAARIVPDPQSNQRGSQNANGGGGMGTQPVEIRAPGTPPEQRREIKPGFAAEQHSMQPFADELPKGPGEAPDNIHVNYDYINTPMDVKLAMQRMAEIDQANIQKHRGGTEGVKSWAEANAEQAKYLNDILGGGPDTLKLFMPADPDAPKVDARLGILKKLAVGAAEDSARRRDVILAAGHDATVRQQLEYMGSIERARMIQAEFLGERASVARALNALKDTTEGTGEIGRMLEAIGVGDPNTMFQTARTPAEEQAYLKAQLDQIMLNYKGKSVLDIARLHKEIGTLKGTFKLAKELEKATTWEMLVEGWRAGLLSGPVTHTTNLFGTGAFMAMRAPVDALATIIGVARGASPGMGESDRASMSEAVARITGMLGGVQEGLKVGFHTFQADEATGKTEQHRQAIPGLAGRWIRTPLRLMGAEDAIVSTMYRRGEMKTLAIRQAFDENLNPGTREFAERVDFLMDHPLPAMEVKADDAATRMTFNAPLGEKGVALQGFVNKWNLQWMIPFIRTPINITKELARISPFAPIVGEWRADITKGGVARDRALAEIALGSGIMALTMSYAFDGTISGAGSPDQGKNRGKVGVWQPYSIQIGDTWYEYSRIQPTGTLMGLAADLANVWDHMTDEEKDKVPKMLAIAFSNAVTNQTFLQGITNFVNASSDPTRFAPRFFQQLAASTVPNIIAQPTAMADPYVREVNSVIEAIQARIPGMRQDLLPKRDWLGQEIQSKERTGVVMPIREQPISEDKVRLEAARLDISMAAAPKKTHIGKGTGKIGDIELTPEERDTFEKVGGNMAHNILTNIVNAPGWDTMPPLVQKRVFAKVLHAAHQVAAVAALPMDKRTAYIQSISEKIAAELEPGETQ